MMFNNGQLWSNNDIVYYFNFLSKNTFIFLFNIPMNRFLWTIFKDILIRKYSSVILAYCIIYKMCKYIHVNIFFYRMGQDVFISPAMALLSRYTINIEESGFPEDEDWLLICKRTNFYKWLPIRNKYAESFFLFIIFLHY